MTKDEALAKIAQGVPLDDEWHSAADFMEMVAETLDQADIERPAHYEEE